MAWRDEPHQCERHCRTDWYLVWDRSHFHVYVMADIHRERVTAADATEDDDRKPRRRWRIDWQDKSMLEFKHYDDKPYETLHKVGTTGAYCRRCIREVMSGLLHEYRLWGFNCRTVSYMIVVTVLGFDGAAVYRKFAQEKTLCGLDRSACFSLDELQHYIAWRESRGESIFKLTT